MESVPVSALDTTPPLLIGPTSTVPSPRTPSSSQVNLPPDQPLLADPTQTDLQDAAWQYAKSVARQAAFMQTPSFQELLKRIWRFVHASL